MAAITTTCTVVKCDECGDGWQHNDESGTPHFETIEEARKYVLPEPSEEPDDEDNSHWTIVPHWTIEPNRWLCGDCSAKAKCAAEGHKWGEWTGCYCGGSTPEHRGGRTADHRGCYRCSAYERREVDGECRQVPSPPPASKGAWLVHHRANYVLWVLAHPEDAKEPHVVPPEVEALVAEAAGLVAQIDEALPADYVVR